MGPIAKAVTGAVRNGADDWWWWCECDRVSTIHRRQAWPVDWKDDAAMRCAIRYPVSAETRNVLIRAEAE